jgi:hypothetical protein
MAAEDGSDDRELTARVQAARARGTGSLSPGVRSAPGGAGVRRVPPETPTTPVTPPAGGRDQGTADAKGQVAGLAHGTIEARKHAAGVAREHASAVAAEAGRKGKNLLRQAQEELGQQAFSGTAAAGGWGCCR